MAILRSASKYPGGKGAISHKLIPLSPKNCTKLVETHAGMLSFLLNSKKREVEIANDSNPDVINFWKIFQSNHEDFLDAISFIEYSRDNFEIARNGGTIDKLEDPPEYTGSWRLDHAIAFFIRHRMSRSGDGKSYSWSDRPRGGQAESLNSWWSIQKQIPLIAERIKDVDFRCGDAENLILGHQGGDNVFMYCDPPYISEERKTKNLYIHEMNHLQHARLIQAIQGCSGSVMISGYNNDLYNNALVAPEWNKIEFPVKCTAGQTAVKSSRIEVIWRNYPC